MTTTTTQIEGLALLFVEDEYEARGMLGRMLGLNYPGLRVYLAESGAAGL